MITREGNSIIHVKLPDFQGGESPPPFHINENESVDKAFVYLLSTMFVLIAKAVVFGHFEQIGTN